MSLSLEYLPEFILAVTMMTQSISSIGAKPMALSSMGGSLVKKNSGKSWRSDSVYLPYYIFFRSAGCPESRCFLTSDRNYLGSVSEFDAIIFHQRSIRLKDTPATRRPEQRYVQWMFESPAHSNYDFTPAKKLAGFFNWSMTYRLDSTFPRPYGMFKEVSFSKVLFI